MFDELSTTAFLKPLALAQVELAGFLVACSSNRDMFITKPRSIVSALDRIHSVPSVD
jgi:hypothetical protein